MKDLYALAGPLLRTLPPEGAHAFALWALERGLAGSIRPRVDDERLRVTLGGLTFPNPVGLAAGFDKNARVYGPMLAQGFGYVEVGSVTPKPQPGNPKPRVFRIAAARAAINRLGFNNDGADAVARRLQGRRRGKGIVGVNLGKNKTSADSVADYRTGAEVFAPLSDYLVINVSSPNTPGLRGLQNPRDLTEIVAAVRAVCAGVPVWLKIAPDLSDEALADIVAFALDSADGLVVGNTTIQRPQGLPDEFHDEVGGLSGEPLFELSTRVLSEVFRECRGRLPLIGVGGIVEGEQGYRKITAGASLLQLYTGLIYAGTALVGAINRAIVAGLERDGFSSVAEAVGARA